MNLDSTINKKREREIWTVGQRAKRNDRAAVVQTPPAGGDLG
jgi:hypothetical protein